MFGLVLLLLGIRECAICGALATYECKNCFREFGDGLDKISFCDICLTKVAVLLLSVNNMTSCVLITVSER